MCTQCLHTYFYWNSKIGLVGQNAKSAMRSMRSANNSTKSSTNYKKFEFENRGPLPSDFGFQCFACPAREQDRSIYCTYEFCCNQYTSPKHTFSALVILISAKWSSNAIPKCTWQLDTIFIGTSSSSCPKHHNVVCLMVKALSIWPCDLESPVIVFFFQTAKKIQVVVWSCTFALLEKNYRSSANFPSPEPNGQGYNLAVQV